MSPGTNAAPDQIEDVMSIGPPHASAASLRPAASMTDDCPANHQTETSAHAILICGVGTGNIGNDASLAVARRLLMSYLPDVRLVLATPFIDGAREVTDLPVIPVRQDLTVHRALPSRAAIIRAIVSAERKRLSRVWHRIRENDAIIVSGTGIFDDFGERPWNMPYALLSWAVLARLAGRPFIFLAVGAGPVHNLVSRMEFILAARLATSVTYRDEGSRRFMAGIGAARSDARVCPDLAFGFRTPQFQPARPMLKSITIGVGVMSYGGWSKLGEGQVYRDYVGCLVGTVNRLLAEGHRVRFLVGQPCDVPVAMDVIEGCSAAAKTDLEMPEIDSFERLLKVISETDLIIATRYHNVVAALLMHRPVVSLSYAPKNADLLSYFGLSAFDRSIESASPQWVLNRVSEYRSGQAALDARAETLLTHWSTVVEDEVRCAAKRLNRRKADPIKRVSGVRLQRFSRVSRP